MSIWLGNQRLDNVTTVPTNVSAFTNDAGYVTNAYHDSTKQDVATAVNYDNITNCITEIPQDIKLELSSGTLRLKAGSKVYVPNGVDNFDELVITSDITVGATSDGKYMIYVNTSRQLYAKKASGFVSGAGTPQAISDGVWYNTTANRIEWYNGAAWSGNGGRSFPIAIATVSSGAISTIDQVFNGFGYIGSTVFALPGVKGLIPNGRNEEGSLKSIEFTVSRVLTHTRTIGLIGAGQIIVKSDSVQFGDYVYKYNYDENINKFYYVPNGDSSWCNAGTYNINGLSVVSFNSKTAFHALDYNDSEYIANQAMPSSRYVDLTFPAQSGRNVIAPADGYITIAKISGVANAYLSIDVVSNNERIINAFTETSTTTRSLALSVPVSKGDIVYVYYSATGTTSRFRFVYANGSK